MTASNLHAAIRFTLERLQESARRSGYFLPAFFMYYEEDGLISHFLFSISIQMFYKYLTNIVLGYIAGFC